MTNNSTKTRDQFVEKCQQLGFNANKEEIISTAYLSALYLHQLDFKQKVYIVGPPAITEELETFGIESFGHGPDLMVSDVRTFKNSMKLEKNVAAVIVGYDEHISYPKVSKAFAYLQDENCLFIATNNDPTKKTKNPKLKLPGAGCMVELLRTSTMREPTYMGKPDVYMQKTILSNPKINPHRTLMIGDKPSTDILLGKRCGFRTLMVLTGSTTLQQVQRWKETSDPNTQHMIPDFYIPSLGELLPRL
ncbi:glycerol-3-phosphate phosphatase-like isoform X2 [Macrosteles quadrilineatus]|nr:glycerol-3-phosphate phosphatase-like isoform X2 [Macrosteles quadrilineatus]